MDNFSKEYVDAEIEYLDRLNRRAETAAIRGNKFLQNLGIQELYNVILVINNLVERSYIFINYEFAYNKFTDLCGDFCHNWDILTNGEKDIILSHGWVKFHTGSVCIKKVRINE